MSDCKSRPIADAIRRAADKSGLSVYRIAKDTGLSQSALNRFFNGTRDNIRLDVGECLFEYFELHVAGEKKSKRKSQ